MKYPNILSFSNVSSQPKKRETYIARMTGLRKSNETQEKKIKE